MKKRTVIGILLCSLLAISFTYAATEQYGNIEVKTIKLGPNVINYNILTRNPDPKVKNDAVIIYLDGEGYDSALGVKDGDNWKKLTPAYELYKYLPTKFDLMVPEKLNVASGASHKDDPKVIENYTLFDRAVAAKMAIDRFLSNGDYQDVYIIGYSEGAVVLANIYKDLRYQDQVKGIALLAGGGLSASECLKILQKSKLPMDLVYKQSLADLDNSVKAIKKEPKAFDKNYLGWTYQRWDSILGYKPLKDLVDIQDRILVIQGDLDTIVPVESARGLAAAFDDIGKTNLKYVEIPGVDHNFNGNYEQVVKEIETWIEE